MPNNLNSTAGFSWFRLLFCKDYYIHIKVEIFFNYSIELNSFIYKFMSKFESSSRICHVYILRDYISRNYPQNSGENGHFDTSEKPVAIT